MPLGDRADLLTPSRFAERVGVTTGEILKLHQRGIFLAAVHGGKGRGKQRLYTPEQVAECRQALRGVAQPRAAPAPKLFNQFADVTAEDAQKGFRALRAGKDLEDLVLEDGLHPDTVVALMEAWTKLCGTIFVSAEILKQISLLTLDGPLPITSEKDLLEVLTIASSENACSACKKQRRSVCKKCVAVAVLQARQEERERMPPPATPTQA